MQTTPRQFPIEPIKLGNQDLNAIHLLQQHGRIHQSEIARSLRMSKPGVAYRLKRLEEAHLLTGYKTHIDISKLGFKIGVFEWTCPPSVSQSEAIQDTLVQHPQVLSVYTGFHPTDFLVGIAYQTPVDLKTFQAWIETHTPLERHTFHSATKFEWVPLNYAEKPLEIKKRHQRDVPIGPISKDKLILLDKLNENGRITLLEIAQALQTTPQSAKTRLHALQESGIIAKISASVNPFAFNQILVAWFIHLSPETQHEWPAWIAAQQCCNGFVWSEGEYSVIAFTHFKNTQSIHGFEERLRQRFPSGMEYRSTLLDEQLCLNWFPPFVKEKLEQEIGVNI